MIFGPGGGGYGMQESDPNLGDKLAALKRRRGNLDDKVADFLQRDLGVDPAALPYTSVQAREFLFEQMDQRGHDTMRFEGNSLGLNSLVSSGYDDDTVHVTSYQPGGFTWPDLVRAHQALTKEHPGYYTFCISRNYDAVTCTPVDATPVRHCDPTEYPPGSVLRIQRQRVEGDHLVLDHQYIRIGGLLDETTPTILETMRPIHELTGWIVTEEL